MAETVLSRHIARRRKALLHEDRALRYRRRGRPSSAVPVTPAKTASRFRCMRKMPKASRAASARRSGSASHRPWRARFAAPRSRALPLRPRHGRQDRSDQRQSRLVDRQAPQARQGFSGRAKRSWNKLANGTPTKRVGIRPDGKAPAREGTDIADKTGRVIGRITSGGFGPTLNAPVAMGYVESAFAADGTEIDLMVRGKPMPARVAPMPFVAAPLQAQRQGIRTGVEHERSSFHRSARMGAPRWR